MSFRGTLAGDNTHLNTGKYLGTRAFEYLNPEEAMEEVRTDVENIARFLVRRNEGQCLRHLFCKTESVSARKSAKRVIISICGSLN